MLNAALRAHAGLYLSVAALLTLNQVVLAQWSQDPATPLVICDAADDQRLPSAVADGSGGWYTFWSDARNGSTARAIYGQHLNNDGVALWDANGRLLYGPSWTSANEVAAVSMDNGRVMLAVMSKVNNANGADTVRALLIDDQAQPVWSAPTVLSVNGPGIFGNCFGYSAPQGIRSGDGAFFCYIGDSQGSNGFYAMQRVRADGTVAFPVPGMAVPYNAGYGPFQVLPDEAGGMVVGWRCSNGAGTCHRAMRVDSLGAAQWPANLDVSAGGAGLSYAFTMASDGHGGIVSVWEESSDLGMARFDTSGTMLWAPSPLYACTESHAQASPAAVFVDGDLFVAWGDNRPPASNQSLYLQRIDTASGAAQWDPDGVLAIQENSYIPSASIVASDSGAVIVMMDFNLGTKYSAMRVRNDGTAAWPAPVSFSTGPQPFYTERVQLPDGNGGVVAFWRSQVGDLYGARIYRNGIYYNDVSVNELMPTAALELFPNPAEEQLTVRSTERVDRVELCTADGRMVYTGAPRVSTFQVPVGTLPAGLYTVRTFAGEGIGVARFIKR